MLPMFVLPNRELDAAAFTLLDLDGGSPSQLALHGRMDEVGPVLALLQHLLDPPEVLFSECFGLARWWLWISLELRR